MINNSMEKCTKLINHPHQHKPHKYSIVELVSVITQLNQPFIIMGDFNDIFQGVNGEGSYTWFTKKRSDWCP